MLFYILVFTSFLDLVMVSEQSGQTVVLPNGVSNINPAHSANRLRRSEEINDNVKTFAAEKEAHLQSSGAETAQQKNVNHISIQPSSQTPIRKTDVSVQTNHDKNSSPQNVGVNSHTDTKTGGILVTDNTIDSQSDNTETFYKNGKLLKKFGSGALLRGFYVFIGLSVIAVMYFVVRAVGLRKRRWGPRRYGVLSNGIDVELTPLGTGDGDDEESTVFDRTSLIK